jgi:hypothetical protein
MDAIDLLPKFAALTPPPPLARLSHEYNDDASVEDCATISPDLDENMRRKIPRTSAGLGRALLCCTLTTNVRTFIQQN